MVKNCASLVSGAALVAVCAAGCVRAPGTARIGGVARIEAIEPDAALAPLDPAPSLENASREDWPEVAFVVPNDLPFRTRSFGAPRFGAAARTAPTPAAWISWDEGGAWGGVIDAVAEPFVAVIDLALLPLAGVGPAGGEVDDGGGGAPTDADSATDGAAAGDEGTAR